MKNRPLCINRLLALCHTCEGTLLSGINIKKALKLLIPTDKSHLIVKVDLKKEKIELSSQHASSWDPVTLSELKTLDSGSKAYRNDDSLYFQSQLK